MNVSKDETETDKAQTIQDYLRNCNGTDNYYRHPLSQIVYTDGVKFVAETAGAYWLIDAILSHQRNRKAVHAADGFQVWRLKHHNTDSGADLTMDDGNGNVLILQRIEYTDFPKGVEVVLYIDGDALKQEVEDVLYIDGDVLMQGVEVVRYIDGDVLMLREER